jgi:LPS O-antigen subunit length determinant protein (WzzB/FepE family)
MDPAPHPDPAERPDDEDYDLLTYGEVAARISEVLAEEHAELERLRAADPTDAKAVEAQQQRIEQLVASRSRYEEQARTSEAFVRKFGLTPRNAAPDER